MFAINSQNRLCEIGRNALPRCLDRCRIGTIIRIRIENSRARTPPSLLGIERRIA